MESPASIRTKYKWIMETGILIKTPTQVLKSIVRNFKYKDMAPGLVLCGYRRENTV